LRSSPTISPRSYSHPLVEVRSSCISTRSPGEGLGVDRLTGEEFNGSARIVLETNEAGGFTRLRYFERATKAKDLQDRLVAEYPGRDIKVYGGDCNVEVPKALVGLRHLKWAPTFAFIDPDGMELAWQTLECLADHKRGYRPSGSPKPEYSLMTSDTPRPIHLS
jgi:hypothetical protein